jgi:predicted peptidase
MWMKTVCAWMMAVAVLLGCAGCGDFSAETSLGKGTTGFLRKEMVRGTRKRVYALFVPSNYDAKKKYPTIVFLHGIGEGGNDATANLRVGIGPYVYAQRDDFPFIVIFPQSDTGEWKENSEAAADVIPCLDDVAKHYSVDPERVILTGVSTGGYGTWAIGAKHKDRFAALVPMATNADVRHFVPQLVDMPIRAYANVDDGIAGFGLFDRSAVEMIRNLGGTRQVFSDAHGAGHNCWDRVYGAGEVFGWMLGQRRR